MYFKNFSDIYYNFIIGGKQELKIVKDITFNVRPIKKVLENIIYYEDYNILDGDTPEIISEKLYGTPTLHWVIMLVNEKYDYLEDFPIPSYILDDYIIKKYNNDMYTIEEYSNEAWAVGGVYYVHQIYGRDHYVNVNGKIVDGSENGAAPVTNYDWEYQQNESKRKIRVVNPKIISVFIKDLETYLGG